MNYLMLVNKNNLLERTYIPDDLIDSGSIYRDNILVCKKVARMFKLMRALAKGYGYNIDIMSGYRDYNYQEKLYNKLVLEKGFNYAFRYIALPGASEHQTGLAVDVCVYRDNKCYVEHEIIDFEELNFVLKNAPLYLLRVFLFLCLYTYYYLFINSLFGRLFINPSISNIVII